MNVSKNIFTIQLEITYFENAGTIFSIITGTPTFKHRVPQWFVSLHSVLWRYSSHLVTVGVNKWYNDWFEEKADYTNNGPMFWLIKTNV